MLKKPRLNVSALNKKPSASALRKKHKLKKSALRRKLRQRDRESQLLNRPQRKRERDWSKRLRHSVLRQSTKLSKQEKRPRE